MRLCAHLLRRAEATGVELFVVFVSNQARQVPVWNQLLADSRDEPVLWDYHGEGRGGGVKIPARMLSVRMYVLQPTAPWCRRTNLLLRAVSARGRENVRPVGVHAFSSLGERALKARWVNSSA